MITLLIVLAVATQDATPPTSSPKDKIAGLSMLVDMYENQREWGETDRKVATSIAASIRREWGSCLERSEDRLRRSNEPVETVATAVMGSCLTEERLYQRGLAASFRGLADPMERVAQAKKSVEALRTSTREEIISRLVNNRLPPLKPR